MKIHLNVTFETSEGGRRSTFTVERDGRIVGQSLWAVTRSRSEMLMREKRAVLSGILLAALDEAIAQEDAKKP